MAAFADIPEEDIWLAKQKSARTRRAYRLDVRHFMAALGITSPADLRQVDHRAVIAWERQMREIGHAVPSTIRRRLSALSSLFKHLACPTPTRWQGCATAPCCRSACRPVFGAPRSPPSRSATCTGTGGMIRCASSARAGAATRSPSTACCASTPSGHRDPSTTRLYDRRGYNPEKAASFCAVY